MRWLGKAAGAGIGALIGGFAGAAVGAVIGHGVDYVAAARARRKPPAMFIAAFLSRFVAETGHFGPDECHLIAKLCFDTRQSGNLSLQDIHGSLREWAAEEAMFEHALQKARTDPAFRYALLTFGWQVASCDNHVDELEAAWLVRAGEAMGASEEDLRISRIPYFRDPEEDDADLALARKTLGVSETATNAEIHRRFRKLTRKYRAKRRGAEGQVSKERAEARLTDIEAAYYLLQTSWEQRYWGLATDHKKLFVPAAGESVRCFLCGKAWQLPDEQQFGNARCRKCHALLLFEKELAWNIFASMEKLGLLDCKYTEEDRVSLENIREALGDFNDRRLHLAPSIPPVKLNNAVRAFGCGVLPSSVLLLYDNSLWGSARCGLMLTTSSVCFRNVREDPVRIPYGEIETVLHVDRKGFFLGPVVVVNGHRIDLDLAVDASGAARILAETIQRFSGRKCGLDASLAATCAGK
ncbi:MAG: hypothetical protein KatS3mg110_0319 [Pirellulaceae bacterium]|nr:MAG: hypothetical protein KatS3mg110_0319 [Pirellulaceae bacterium]